MMPYQHESEQQYTAESYDSRLLWTRIFLSMKQQGMDTFEPAHVRINGLPLLPADLPLETPHDTPLIDVQGDTHIPDVWKPVERALDTDYTAIMSGYGELLSQPDDVIRAWVEEMSHPTNTAIYGDAVVEPAVPSEFGIEDARTWVAGVRRSGLENALRLSSAQYILGDVMGQKNSMIGLENTAGTVVTVTPVFARVMPETPMDIAQLQNIQDPTELQAALAAIAESGQTIESSQSRLLSHLIDAVAAGAPHMRRALRITGQAVLGLAALTFAPVGAFDPLLTHIAIPEHLRAQNTTLATAADNLNAIFQYAVRQSVTSMADARIAQAITTQGGEGYDEWLRHEQAEHVRLLHEIQTVLGYYCTNFYATIEASAAANLPVYVTPSQAALVDVSARDFFTGIENIEALWG